MWVLGDTNVDSYVVALYRETAVGPEDLARGSMPVVDSIEQLNELLAAADANDDHRRIRQLPQRMFEATR
jgi:hypothetical protein